MFFGMLTIDNDGFSMVLGLSNHWFQWFSMVKDHWSNDGMVSMDRTGLPWCVADSYMRWWSALCSHSDVGRSRVGIITKSKCRKGMVGMKPQGGVILMCLLTCFFS